MSAEAVDSHLDRVGPVQGTTPRVTQSTRLLPLWSVLVTLALLEAVTRGELIGPSVLPPPTAVGVEVMHRLVSTETWPLVLATVQGLTVGLGAAALVGVVLGVILGLVPLLDRLLSGVLELVRPIPSIALIPLCVMVLGVGMETKYVLAFIGSLWPILIHTVLGVRGIDMVARDSCRSYGISRLGRLRHLILPTAMPQFLTGLRVSAAIAMIVCITVELIVGVPGLGQAVNLAQQSGDTAGMWAGIIIIGALGTALNAGFLRLERWTLHWHTSQREEAL